MSASDNQMFGDGSDNYLGAAQKAAEAGKQIAAASAEKAAATANAAAASTNAAVQSGAAVSQVAAGTAAGGPWGAILAAAWSMRHTLFKVLICIILLLLFIICMVVLLPSIVFNSIFHTDPETVSVSDPADPWQMYDEVGFLVSDRVQEGYDYALEDVNRIIEDGGYDYEFSMEALIDLGYTADYDVTYVLSAYSASKEQRGTSKSDMSEKLEAVKESMFPVSFVEKEKERVIPLLYTTYSGVTVTVITGRNPYTISTRTYYAASGTAITTAPITRSAYVSVSVEVPVYTGANITGTRTETYFEISGMETLTPATEMVKYAECTIHEFDTSVILTAFQIDPDATYGQFNIANSEAIQHMSDALRLTLFNGMGVGGGVTGSGTLTWPSVSSTRVTSRYGPRRHPITGVQETHLGIDIGAAPGTDVLSADSGTVISTNVHWSYGRHLLIDHGNGTRTLYAHMSALNVGLGASVEQGQAIGQVGSTGSSTNPHLHFEVIVEGNHVDPLRFFSNYTIG